MRESRGCHSVEEGKDVGWFFFIFFLKCSVIPFSANKQRGYAKISYLYFH